MPTQEDAMNLASDNHATIIDLKFADLAGGWQHLSIAKDMLTEKLFKEGISLDGSSIPGFQTINESDMLMIPDASTAFIDPFMTEPTLSMICNIVHPITRDPYTRDPRYIAQKAEEYLRSTNIADVAYFGPEIEFYIFDGIRYISSPSIQYARIDSIEAHWNSQGRDDQPNLGHFMNERSGYFPVSPNDTLQDLRTEMLLMLKKLGIPAEVHHHEVGAAGQTEIRFHYDTLVKTADQVLLYKYVMKNVARKRNKTVTFMPKPIAGDNGSGMHTHQSLWQHGIPLFHNAEDREGGLSELAHYYIGGILKHTPAILAIAAPSTNSYKRLVPGFEAPVNLVYSKGNRSAAVRIPLTSDAEAKRIEFRPPDPTANPYLLFSALLMAGLDGIRNAIDPSDEGFGPDNRDLYSLSGTELEEISSVPRSLEESLKALENDHAFLLEGNVFTNDLIEKYLELKYEQTERVRLCPTPIEFSLYYDA